MIRRIRCNPVRLRRLRSAGKRRRALAGASLLTALAVFTILQAAPAAAVTSAAGPARSRPADLTGGQLRGPKTPVPLTPSHLGRLLHHLGDGDVLRRLSMGAGAAAVVSPLDTDWSEDWVEHRPLGADARDIGRRIGHRETVAWTVLALTGGGVVLGNSRLRTTGLLLLESQLLSAGVVELLKGMTHRRRPDGSNRRSFPSGHAAAAWTTAEVLRLRLGWWVGGPAYGVALYTGLSRIQGNKHYGSDVLAAFALSHWIATAASRASEEAGESVASQEKPAGGTQGQIAAPQAPRLSWLPWPEPGDMGLPLMRARF